MKRSMQNAVGRDKSSAEPSIRWFHEVQRDGVLAFRVGKRGEDLIAHWPGRGTLTCARDGSGSRFSPVPGAPVRVVDKLRGAQVRGLLRDLAGKLAVHASAVSVGGRAVLFLGGDGAGKSTAAAEMCIQQGARLYADDAACIEVGLAGVHLVPCEEHHWLTRTSRLALGMGSEQDETRSDKRRLRAAKVAREPSPLALVLALRFEPSIGQALLRPLRGSDAARLLLEAVIRFDVEDGVARGRELEQLTAVYNCAPFFELLRPPRDPGPVAHFVIDALARGNS